MVASYLLSSTFVPVLSVWLLRHHRPTPARPTVGRSTPFASAVDALAVAGLSAVRWAWSCRPTWSARLVVIVRGRGPRLGVEIFPRVDAGQFQLRLRAPDGTHIERDRADRARQPWSSIGEEVGPDERRDHRSATSACIPSSYPINAIYQWTGGPEEARAAGRLEAAAIRLASSGSKERPPRAGSAGQLPGRAVLVRAGRHRQRGDELRLADAGRGRGQRPEPAADRATSREKLRPKLAQHPVAARPAVSASRSTIPTRRGRDRPREGGAQRRHADRRRALARRRPPRRAASSSRTTGPIRRPASATRSRSRSPISAMTSLERRRERPRRAGTGRPTPAAPRRGHGHAGHDARRDTTATT